MGDILLTAKPSSHVRNQLGQLGLPSLRGKEIEYQPVWQELGAFTCVCGSCVIQYGK